MKITKKIVAGALAGIVCGIMAFFPIHAAFAGSATVESGGYQFFPFLKITNTNTAKPSVSVEPSTKINLNGQTGTAAISGNTNNSVIVSGASLSKETTTTLGTNTNPWVAWFSTATSTASTNQSAFVMSQDARLCMDGATCAQYLTGAAAGPTIQSPGKVITLNASTALNGSVNTLAGLVRSSVASGSNAIEFTNNGARLDLGPGANDYIYSDGTHVNVASNIVAAGSIYGSTIYHQSGGAFRGSGNIFSTLIGSLRTAASTTATSPAILIKPDVALDSGDAVVAIQKSDGTNILIATEDTNVSVTGTLTTSNLILSAAAAAVKDAGAGTRISLPNLNTTSIFGRAADAASAVGVVLDNTTTFTTTGAKLVSVRNNTTEVLNVRPDSTLQFVGVDVVPTCNAALRGGVQYERSTNQLKYCDGTNWIALTASLNTWVDTFNGHDPGLAVDVNGTLASFKTKNDGGKAHYFAHTSLKAGTGGTTQLVRLYNVTGAAAVCEFTVPCTAAAGVTTAGSCTANLAGGSVFEFRIVSSTCTTRPMGNITLNYGN